MATSKRTLWNKLGRFITGLVIGCFFLPFFGVSCQGMDVITVSGADMVGGCKPGGLISEAADEGDKHGGGGHMSGGGSLDMKIDKVPREPLAIAAFALAVLAFAAAWVRTRGALAASFALALAGLGALIGLYVKVGGDLKDQVGEQLDKGGSKKNELIGKDDVDAGARMGLYAACIGMLGAAALTGMALREKETELPRAVAQPPPPAG